MALAATKMEEVTPKNMPQMDTEDPDPASELEVGSVENTSSWSTPNQKPNMMTAQQLRALKSTYLSELSVKSDSSKRINMKMGHFSIRLQFSFCIHYIARNVLLNNFFPERCPVTEDEVSEENVENCGQGSAHVVEGDADILEAQVVGGDHQDKHDRERQDLLHSWQPDFQTVRKARNFQPAKNSKTCNCTCK